MTGRTSSRLTSSASAGPTPSSARPPTAATAPGQKRLPTTEASSRTVRASAGSASIRDASSAWIDGGMASIGDAVSRPGAPSRSTAVAATVRSRSMAASCSAYSGLPPARASTASWSGVVASAPGACGSSTAPMSARISASGRPARGRTVARRVRASQPGWRSPISGRAVTSRSRGRPAVSSARLSRKAARASSAQCRSSMTNTAGPAAAIDARKRRHAAKASSGVGGSLRLVPPASGASRSSIQRRTPSSGSASTASSFASRALPVVGVQDPRHDPGRSRREPRSRSPRRTAGSGRRATSPGPGARRGGGRAPGRGGSSRGRGPPRSSRSPPSASRGPARRRGRPARARCRGRRTASRPVGRRGRWRSAGGRGRAVAARTAREGRPAAAPRTRWCARSRRGSSRRRRCRPAARRPGSALPRSRRRP